MHYLKSCDTGEGSNVPSETIQPPKPVFNPPSSLPDFAPFKYTEPVFNWDSVSTIKNLFKRFDNENHPHNEDVFFQNQCEFTEISMRSSFIEDVVKILGGREALLEHPLSLSHVVNLVVKSDRKEIDQLRDDSWPTVFLIEGAYLKEIRQEMVHGTKFELTDTKHVLPVFVSHNKESKEWSVWSHGFSERLDGHVLLNSGDVTGLPYTLLVPARLVTWKVRLKIEMFNLKYHTNKVIGYLKKKFPWKQKPPIQNFVCSSRW